jgi:hypothetical protein
MPDWFPDNLDWSNFEAWINVELFEQLLARRKETAKKKNINSPLAVTKLLNRLQKQYYESWPIDAMLEQAIAGGWLWTFTKGHEQRRRPIRAAGPLFDVVQPLVEKTKIPEPNNRGRKALAALQSVLQEKEL